MAGKRSIDCLTTGLLTVVSRGALALLLTVALALLPAFHQAPHEGLTAPQGAGLALASGVYQWRDEQGRLHFGDRPPETEAAEDLSARYDYRLPFELIIEGRDYALPVALRQKMEVHVKKIFTIYQQALNIEYQAEQFRIVIYGSETEFRRYQKRVAPVLENAAGFYSGANNQITTWALPNERVLLGLIVHECSHAISASGGHQVATWLNEGLASYFEGIRVAGLSAEVPLPRHWPVLLRRHRFDQRTGALASLIRAPHSQWYAANGPDNLSYVASASLVWFLLDSEAGRTLLSRLLRTPQTDNGVGLINQHWPGGLNGLENDWANWLVNAAGTHRY